MMKKYIALVEKGDKDTAYGVVFPDLPGCFSGGDTFDEAIKNAREALAFHVDGLKEDGIAVPEPRTLDQIKAEWEGWSEWKDNYDFVVANISLLPPFETEKILMSMDSCL